jgi:hypothetical protein
MLTFWLTVDAHDPYAGRKYNRAMMVTGSSFSIAFPLFLRTVQLMNERMMAAADSSQHSPAVVAAAAAATTTNPVNHAGTRQTTKKANAAERIGVNNKTRRR